MASLEAADRPLGYHGPVTFERIITRNYESYTNTVAAQKQSNFTEGRDQIEDKAYDTIIEHREFYEDRADRLISRIVYEKSAMTHAKLVNNNDNEEAKDGASESAGGRAGTATEIKQWRKFGSKREDRVKEVLEWSDSSRREIYFYPGRPDTIIEFTRYIDAASGAVQYIVKLDSAQQGYVGEDGELRSPTRVAHEDDFVNDEGITSLLLSLERGHYINCESDTVISIMKHKVNHVALRLEPDRNPHRITFIYQDYIHRLLSVANLDEYQVMESQQFQQYNFIPNNNPLYEPARWLTMLAIEVILNLERELFITLPSCRNYELLEQRRLKLQSSTGHFSNAGAPGQAEGSALGRMSSEVEANSYWPRRLAAALFHSLDRAAGIGLGPDGVPAVEPPAETTGQSYAKRFSVPAAVRSLNTIPRPSTPLGMQQ